MEERQQEKEQKTGAQPKSLLSEEAQKKELLDLLVNFSDVIRDRPGRMKEIEHTIVTNVATPVHQRPYRLPYSQYSTVKMELEQMESMGIIRTSTSEWASPIVIVPKKDGLCVDYWNLNRLFRLDAYPMPRVDEMIDRIGQGKYISTLDLNKGYWEVPVEETSQSKTAFATPFGLYEFITMPFGLQGAPATFQRLMNKIPRGVEKYASTYIDDVAIYSETWEDHLKQF